MRTSKKQSTLTGKVVLAWMLVLAISNIIIGLLSYTMYRDQLLTARALEAENVAISMAVRIDGDKFTEVLETLEKNDYWQEIKAYADRISVVFNTAFIYILDAEYDDYVTYFAEGAPGDAPFDLGTTEIIEGIYADEMFETIKTGEPSITEPYPSGEYGDMVSGFAAITNKAGDVVGVVGVDFFYVDVEARLSAFALSLSVIILSFLILCYFFMNHLGTKLAGKPLSDLDFAARRLSVGDMDIEFNFRSKTEIGRLADSFIRMINAIKEQVLVLEALSHGDLTSSMKMRSDKDTMGLAISQILSNLNDLFGDIEQSASSVSSVARQISNNAQGLSKGAAEQSAAVDRLSELISHVTDKANECLKIANKTNKLAVAAKSDAQIGQERMTRMTQAVDDISSSSVAISKVIKVIDDIAFQTNILALNAAVESARAGQHGKGFAVVAQEVRNLAAKSAEAAKDTERLIVDSIEKARTGATIASETADSLENIIQSVNECAHLVEGLSGSFDEQIETMMRICDDIEQVSQVVQQNNAAAGESATASQEMSAQADILNNLISRFKLKNPRNNQLS